MASVKAGIAKRPAPSGSPGPAAKARIAKAGGSPALAKPPISKAPGQAARTASPPAEGDGGDGRSETWQAFADSDPLYAMVGEVSTHKVMDANFNLDEELLMKYLDKLFIQKAAKKPKDWVEIWAALDIPVTHQVPVLEPLLRFGLEHDPESLGKIAAELLIGHRVKSKSLQEAVVGACKGEGTDKGFLRETFFLIFPKGPQSEWGWSRVGWSWQEWWKLVEGCYTGLDSDKAFDELSFLLDKLEAEGGKPLIEQTQPWNELRMKKVKTLLCKFGGLQDEND
eukprot:CAMPEP_0172709920 /NCGR_PEP_ID=MMETSP1074-20121228/55350_1 /TAXON_ID=2916 /ORGANISM="Ceratium fusus, Strain PA161109" /LENGTH=281 /DNA_ID=CAMNT_0013533243 /DNA_START=50 /DNA_END=892 /DNA_ORIENTATION=-